MESIPKRVNTFIWIIFLAIIGIGVYYLENRISSTPQEKAESTLIPSIKTESRDSSTQNVTSFQRTVTESDIELIRAKVPKFYKIIVFSPEEKNCNECFKYANSLAVKMQDLGYEAFSTTYKFDAVAAPKIEGSFWIGISEQEKQAYIYVSKIKS